MNKNFSRIFSSPPNDPARRAKRNFWQWLVEPPALITDIAEQRQMSLVSALLLVIIPAMSFGVVVNTFFLHELTTARILAGSVFVLSIAFILTRTRHFRLGLPLLLAVTALYTIFSVSIGNNYSSEGLLTIFIFNILAILISGTLASFRTTIFLATANFLELLLLPILIPGILFSNIVIPLIFIGVVSVLILVLTRHRNLTEQDRLSEVDKINSELQASNADLNAITDDLKARTRDLNLAAEIGRTVSQVRALDVMLKDATEIIRSRFDLYYVQVYLTDQNQTNLILKSGTGNVGAELVGRGHRLPLNTASINGRAAQEKRSVVVADTTASLTFRPNPLLPDTRSEMAVPLLIGEKVVGVLNLQSQQAGALNQEVLTAFEALAGQLAIAIQNATFLAETQQARAEVESQARRQTRANWVEYLDAIHMPEHTGFVFEGNQVIHLIEAEGSQPPAKGNAISAPIAVTGELLGSLVVEMDAENQSTQNVELVNIVARQVAQQIESLRLLESAERYRAEAEQAARRITREGWKDYTDTNAAKGLSYIYDLKEVRSLNLAEAQQAEESAFNLPLKVRDEMVGKLTVLGLEPDNNDALELANAVADRLGAHIESLRQQDQTQSALVQSENLFEASRRLTQAADLQELVAAVVASLKIPEVNRALLVTFDYDAKGDMEHLNVIGNWWNSTGHEVTAIGTRYPLEVIRAMPMFISQTPVFFNDTLDDERVDATTLELVKRLNLRAVAVLPLHLGSRQIGALILEAEGSHIFTQSEIRLFSALAPQVATVLENRRQFERTQKQAEREGMLNVISQKIQSATTVEAVLQIAARELGHALGAPMTIAQLSMKDKQ